MSEEKLERETPRFGTGGGEMEKREKKTGQRGRGDRNRKREIYKYKEKMGRRTMEDRTGTWQKLLKGKRNWQKKLNN